MCETNEGLKVKLNSMNEKLEEMDKRYQEYKISNIAEHKEMISVMSRIEGKLTDFILKAETSYLTKDSAKEKYASKLAERIVYSMVGMVLTGVLGGMLMLILK